jgi:hypothetical protein
MPIPIHGRPVAGARSVRDAASRQVAADQTTPGRRGLQLCLGLIWLLDAALQYQPFMFGPSFITQVIEPAETGNPPWVTSSVTWASHMMLHQVAAFNAVFASIQLLIAAGLFVRRTVKPALALSIVWAVFVWWFGDSRSPLTHRWSARMDHGHHE